jgi:glycosyltransferase involved in cell wall biosynthesis
VDVSVVLNVHREALFLASTLQSLTATVERARENLGLTVELVVVFDRTDQKTRATFDALDLSSYSEVRTCEVEFGSLGLSRNAGVAECHGKYIWASDADDLVSSNSLSSLWATAQEVSGEKVAVFQEFVVSFGEMNQVAKYLDSAYLTAGDFALMNPYTSRIFIEKKWLLDVPYNDVPSESGHAFEDWDINNRLFALGFNFLVATDTTLFYRRRSAGLLAESNRKSQSLAPDSPLFSPDHFLQVSARKASFGRLPGEFPGRRIRAHADVKKISSEQRRMLSEGLQEAAKWDPEIDPWKFKLDGLCDYVNVPPSNDHFGSQLGVLFAMVGHGKGEFSDILIVPDLNPGGAEKYILQVIQSLQLSSSGGFSKLLVISGQVNEGHEWVDKLPEGSVLVDIYNSFPTLSYEDQLTLTARALISYASPGVRLHLKSSAFMEGLIDRYGRTIANHFHVTYYRFCDNYEFYRGSLIAKPSVVSFMRKHLDSFDLVLTDCEFIKDRDANLFGASVNEKYESIYAHQTVKSDNAPSTEPKFRLLWASRISAQKRPELVPQIIARARDRFPNLECHMFGTLDRNDPNLKAMKQKGLRLKGSFDGWDSLPVDRYDALLYTSNFDGLPNILLEAASALVPIVAPDVGGISELVSPETGRLVEVIGRSDDEIIADYVEAIAELYRDIEKTSRMAVAARDLVVRRHSLEVHLAVIHRVFPERVVIRVN